MPTARPTDSPTHPANAGANTHNHTHHGKYITATHPRAMAVAMIKTTVDLATQINQVGGITTGFWSATWFDGGEVAVGSGGSGRPERIASVRGRPVGLTSGVSGRRVRPDYAGRRCLSAGRRVELSSRRAEDHMSDQEGLLRTIAAHPADNTPRLVFADWCDENGRGEWAELIRAQCEGREPQCRPYLPRDDRPT